MISGGVGGRWGIVSSQLKKNLHSWEQLWIKYKKRKQNNRVQINPERAKGDLKDVYKTKIKNEERENG